MPDHGVAGWRNPEPGVRAPEDLDFGTMGSQDADAVAITGGRIEGAVVVAHPQASGVVAVGTTQANAALITAGATAFSTVAAGTGARLPAGDPGVAAYIFNGGANALLVYPAVGGQIDAAGANVALSVAAGKGAILLPFSATQWHTWIGA